MNRMTEEQIKYMVNRFLCWRLREWFALAAPAAAAAAFAEIAEPR